MLLTKSIVTITYYSLLLLLRLKQNLKSVMMLGRLKNATFFSKGYISNWNRKLFNVNEVLKTQPPTYKREDMNGEIIEGKYHEQELFKSECDFESNNKVLESLNIDLRS